MSNDHAKPGADPFLVAMQTVVKEFNAAAFGGAAELAADLSTPPGRGIGSVPGAAPHRLGGHEGGVLLAALGVEFLPLGPTPVGEYIGVYVHADHPMAGSLQALASQLCGGQPIAVGPMQCVAIRKEGSEAFEIFWFVPRKADGVDGGHGRAPGQGGCGSASVSQDGRSPITVAGEVPHG